MGWHPDTEAFRGSREDVEAAFAACALYSQGGYESEEDARPGITRATASCRNGETCRFYPHACRYKHARTGGELFWDEFNALLTRLRSSGGSVTCEGFKYEDTTELWTAAQALDAEGSAELTFSEDCTLLRLPHGALAALLRGGGAAPAALTEQAADAQLAPMLAEALRALDLGRCESMGRRVSGEERATVRAARATLAAGAATTRAMPLAERIRRLERAVAELEVRGRNGRLTVLDVPDGDDFDSYDAEPRRIDQAGLVMHAAAVRLEDALFAARGWLQQVQGGAPTVQAQLHALLVAAHAAGQDVLIYHNVI